MNQINILSTKTLSDNWYTLKRIDFEMTKANGSVIKQSREAYDRGNGAVILLYNKQQGSVVLTRQFRMPTYINGNETGYLIECCAGLLDNDNPENCIKRETEEEIGFRINNVTKIFQAYMSPGSVTEILHFFIAECEPHMKVSDGGGVAHEEENIEVLEMPFEAALQMIGTGEICDAKTIMLLQYAQINNLLSRKG